MTKENPEQEDLTLDFRNMNISESEIPMSVTVDNAGFDPESVRGKIYLDVQDRLYDYIEKEVR